VLGSISNYFKIRYGFSETTSVIVGCGDNLASMVGVGADTNFNESLNDEKSIGVVSLGTSDTFFVPSRHHLGLSHISTFCSALSDEIYVSLVCYKVSLK
jgi:sugar (pentulose or hexulose) kinase